MPSASAAFLQIVVKADQGIAFAPLPDRAYGDPDVAIGGVGSSGNASSASATVTVPHDRGQP